MVINVRKQIILLSALFLLFLVFQGCELFQDKPTRTDQGQTVAENKEADLSIQEYVIREKMKTAVNRFPGDTLDLALYVIKNYPSGSYLAELDNASINEARKSAVLYHTANGKKYVFAIIGKSMEGGKLIEMDNFTGYNSSYVDYDSTSLGTAHIYLSLFSYEGSDFTLIWEEIIPQSGGLMNFSLRNWDSKNIPYVSVYFYSAPQLSSDEYTYFLINGIEAKPHLLNLYDGHIRRRTLANINNDSIPDYYEWRVYYTDSSRVFLDSIAFIWKDSVYFNSRNPRMTKKY